MLRERAKEYVKSIIMIQVEGLDPTREAQRLAAASLTDSIGSLVALMDQVYDEFNCPPDEVIDETSMVLKDRETMGIDKE